MVTSPGAAVPPDPAYDGYLFRLPKALGVRDATEREAIVRLVPKASAVPYEVLGRGELNAAALAALVAHATSGRWQWDDFVEAVDREVREPGGGAGQGDPVG